MNYCGCNMTKISNCKDCYYRSTHQDMGASWDVCTLHKDLSSATIACENSDNCKSKITYKEVNQAIEKQMPKKPCKIREHNQNDVEQRLIGRIEVIKNEMHRITLSDATRI